jgi:type I restriction enzyme S subunit
MSEWKEYRTTDLLEQDLLVIGDGYRAKNIELSATKLDGLPFARVGNINGGFNFHEADYFPTNNLKRVGEKISKVGDVVFTSKGTVGRFAFVNDKSPLFVYSPQLCFWRSLDQNFIFPRFLLYWMQSREFFEQADAVKSQTDMADYVNLADQRKMKITLPDITEQRAISSVLSSLDDKIDLLHRQNQTLEKMAETLFRQWFVEEAREDWETKPLSSIADFLNGLACQKYPPENEIEKLPVLKIKELSSGITENCDWASTEIKPEYIVRNGDVIFAWSASLMIKIWDGQKCILNQHLFKVSSNEYPKWFYFLWCNHHLEEFIAKAASHATTMGHIKRGDLDNALVIIPDKLSLLAMNKTMEPLIEKQIINNNQIRTLSTLRDTLLPKLMSGEVRVEI